MREVNIVKGVRDYFGIWNWVIENLIGVKEERVGLV